MQAHERFPVLGLGSQRPLARGHLVIDDYDPTYGDGGMRIGPELYECLECGALVIDHGLHNTWHVRMSTDG